MIENAIQNTFLEHKKQNTNNTIKSLSTTENQSITNSSRKSVGFSQNHNENQKIVISKLSSNNNEKDYYFYKNFSILQNDSSKKVFKKTSIFTIFQVKSKIDSKKFLMKIINKASLSKECLKKLVNELKIHISITRSFESEVKMENENELSSNKHCIKNINYYFFHMYSYSETDNNIYIILEHIDQIQNVFQLKLNKQKFSVIFFQILFFIKYLHKNHICFMSIRPDNLYIDTDFNIKFLGFDNSIFFLYDDNNNNASLSNSTSIEKSVSSVKTVRNMNIFNKYTEIDVWSIGKLIYDLLIIKYENENLNMKNIFNHEHDQNQKDCISIYDLSGNVVYTIAVSLSIIDLYNKFNIVNSNSMKNLDDHLNNLHNSLLNEIEDYKKKSNSNKNQAEYLKNIKKLKNLNYFLQIHELISDLLIPKKSFLNKISNKILTYSIFKEINNDFNKDIDIVNNNENNSSKYNSNKRDKEENNFFESLIEFINKINTRMTKMKATEKKKSYFLDKKTFKNENKKNGFHIKDIGKSNIYNNVYNNENYFCDIEDNSIEYEEINEDKGSINEKLSFQSNKESLYKNKDCSNQI